MTKVINLMDTCRDAIENLEKAHYECLSKEKIMGTALAVSNRNSNMAINAFYEEYYNAFVNYEKAKQAFYVNHVAEHAQGVSSTATWEINFSTGDLTIYD